MASSQSPQAVCMQQTPDEKRTLSSQMRLRRATHPAIVQYLVVTIPVHSRTLFVNGSKSRFQNFPKLTEQLVDMLIHFPFASLQS